MDFRLNPVFPTSTDFLKRSIIGSLTISMDLMDFWNKSWINDMTSTLKVGF